MEKKRERQMQMVVTKVSVHDQKSDFAYWQTRSHAERLEAVEAARREVHGLDYATESRLQRVFTIVKR